MKHMRCLGKVGLPGGARTLLEWTQKGVVFNSFADALSTLADVKVTLEE
ncbi:MAG: hypothetical protein NTZ09_19720 [Candidatus Hydrogenedentes bacterium]|nr:hypothetical protein [Candidatus Hydrogenedentota bacterium]